MDFGPVESAFGGGTITEREEILRAIWRGKYEFSASASRQESGVFKVASGF
jgi:hypothetical protein